MTSTTEQSRQTARGERFEVRQALTFLHCASPVLRRPTSCCGAPAGSEVLYNNSQPAGYAAEPVETVNYAGCHDGEIIFDQLIMKPADQVTLNLTLILNVLDPCPISEPQPSPDPRVCQSGLGGPEHYLPRAGGSMQTRPFAQSRGSFEPRSNARHTVFG